VVAELIERLNGLGLKVALDTSGEALRAGLEARPWLIKPNTEELADALDCDVVSHAPKPRQRRACMPKASSMW
jgi:1-phosphofructokinase